LATGFFAINLITLSTMKIDKLVNIQLGHPFRGRIEEAEGLDTLVIQYKDVSEDSGVRWSSVSPSEVKGRAEPKWLEPDDVLFTNKGAHFFSVYVEQIPEGKKVVASPHFFVIRCQNTEKLLPEYLNWYLNQGPAQNFYNQSASGSIVKSVTKTRLLEMDIPLPPITEQHRIAELYQATRKHSQALQQQISNNQKLMSQLAYDIKRRHAD